MTTWHTLAERVAALFPDDPHLPAMAAACERDDLALAVYLRVDLFRHLWTHERRQEKDLHAFLDNGAWPAMAVDACLARGLPVPTWCADWLRRVLTGTAKPPAEAQRRRAALALRLWEGVTMPVHATPEKDDGTRPLPPARGWKAHAQWDTSGRLALAVPDARTSAAAEVAGTIGLNERAARLLTSIFREHFDRA